MHFLNLFVETLTLNPIGFCKRIFRIAAGSFGHVADNDTKVGTDVVGVLHCSVGRTPSVGHLLHHEFSPGKNTFLKCRTPTASHFTQPIIRTIFPSFTGLVKL